jgi:hypothetical protein
MPRSRIAITTGRVVSLDRMPTPTSRPANNELGLFNLSCRCRYVHRIRSEKNVPPASSITEPKKSSVGGLVVKSSAAAKACRRELVIRSVTSYINMALKT